MFLYTRQTARQQTFQRYKLVADILTVQLIIAILCIHVYGVKRAGPRYREYKSNLIFNKSIPVKKYSTKYFFKNESVRCKFKSIKRTVLNEWTTLCVLTETQYIFSLRYF